MNSENTAVSPQISVPGDDSISLVEILNLIKSQYRKVLIGIIVSFLLAVLYLSFATPKYSASMLVAASEEQGQMEVRGALGQISAMSGIKLGGDGNSLRFGTFIDTLTSQIVTKKLSQDINIMKQVFEEEWSENEKAWYPPSGIVAFVLNLPKNIFGQPTWMAPSSGRLEDYLIKEISIKDFGDSGLKKISYEHKNPEFAVLLLEEVYSAANESLKSDALYRTRSYIMYLENRLKTVGVAEHRQALAQLLADQERNQMLIEADLPYAARIVSPAIASDFPTTPKIITILVISIFIGTLVGILWIFTFNRT